jgi:hypothetical protein
MANVVLAGANVVHFHAQGSALATKTEADARAALRRRTLKSGIIAYNNRYCTLPCMVRDVSATGARLRVDGTVSAPDTFVLIVESDGLEADCEVVWRKGNEIGVKYVGAPRQVAPKKTQVVTASIPEHAPSIRRKPKTPAPA